MGDIGRYHLLQLLTVDYLPRILGELPLSWMRVVRYVAESPMFIL
jgi:hypothetical protein